jgi:Molybdopterin converting factor, small subunit
MLIMENGKRIQVFFFGKLSEIAGAATTLSNLHNTDELIQHLHTQFPALANEKFAVAVNKQTIHTNTELPDNCTVALLPPFSGG